MRGWAGRALMLAALALLGACNMVMTKDPVFSKADEAGAPRLRDGVWRQDTPSNGPCAFDESRPLASWPTCAGGFVVRGDSFGAFQTQGGKTKWTTTSFVLASGDPEVFQTLLDDAAMGQASIALPPSYIYAALRGDKLDGQGRVVAMTTWFALCGEPPPKDAKGPDGHSQRAGTLHPWPGLTMDKSGNDCTTTLPAAIRASAKLSRKWSKDTDLTTDHWVRDGDK